MKRLTISYQPISGSGERERGAGDVDGDADDTRGGSAMTYDDDCPNCRVEGGVKLCRLHAAAPALLEALKDLFPVSDAETGRVISVCRWCGRSMYFQDGSRRTFTLCPSDDCPGHHARTVVADAEGRDPQEAER